jgi:hypothetical protein
MSADQAVKERPILFSGPMVRAILDGTKTQTRRVVKNLNPTFVASSPTGEQIANSARCPYGQPGDRLWVREAFIDTRVPENPARDLGVIYAADCPPGTPAGVKGGWSPSIHMPRWASRITLELTGVRVQRLQAITAQDAIDEGIPSRGIDRDGPNIASGLVYLSDFETLWDSLNEKRGYGWDTNPWVWALTFKRVESES